MFSTGVFVHKRNKTTCTFAAGIFALQENVNTHAHILAEKNVNLRDLSPLRKTNMKLYIQADISGAHAKYKEHTMETFEPKTNISSLERSSTRKQLFFFFFFWIL